MHFCLVSVKMNRYMCQEVTNFVIGVMNAFKLPTK